MRNFIIFIIVFAVILSVIGYANAGGLETFKKSVKDFKSAWVGIDRKIQIYDHAGNLRYEAEGSFDIDTKKPGRIVFEVNGKRIVTNMDYIAVEED